MWNSSHFRDDLPYFARASSHIHPVLARVLPSFSGEFADSEWGPGRLSIHLMGWPIDLPEFVACHQAQAQEIAALRALGTSASAVRDTRAAMSRTKDACRRASYPRAGKTSLVTVHFGHARLEDRKSKFARNVARDPSPGNRPIYAQIIEPAVRLFPLEPASFILPHFLGANPDEQDVRDIDDFIPRVLFRPPEHDQVDLGHLGFQVLTAISAPRKLGDIWRVSKSNLVATDVPSENSAVVAVAFNESIHEIRLRAAASGSFTYVTTHDAWSKDIRRILDGIKNASV